MVRLPVPRFTTRGTLVLLCAVLAAGGAPAVSARAQPPAAPLVAADLGSQWSMANETWFVPPDGTAATYSATLQRPIQEGMSSRGPVIVALGIDVLPEAPPPEVIEQSVGAVIAAYGPQGAVRLFDEPEVGRYALWYSFEHDLAPLLPEAEFVAPGIVFGVVFQVGNNIVGLTAIGFADQLRLEDAVAIASLVAARSRDFRLA